MDFKALLLWLLDHLEDDLVCYVCSATFVQDFATYWVGVQSTPVQVVRRAASLPDGVNAAPGASGGPGATPARTSRRPTTTTPIPYSPEPEPQVDLSHLSQETSTREWAWACAASRCAMGLVVPL